MSDLTVANFVSQINYHHHLASVSAAEAVFHAREAGRLLIQVKTSLAHGEFTDWMSDNLAISARQAQRYMRSVMGAKLDEGKVGGSKNDMMSHLPKKKATKLKSPTWSPKVGHSYFGVWDQKSYYLDQNQKLDEFHISVMIVNRTSLEDGDECVGDDLGFETATVPISQVEVTLQKFGIAEPGKLWWSVKKSAGISQPYGIF